MSSQIDIVAIITPEAGEGGSGMFPSPTNFLIVELLSEVSQYVKAKEPGTLKYQITRAKDEVIMIESYKDKAALGAHSSSETFQAFQKKLQGEDLVGAPMQLKFLKDAGGFSSRL
ncbi:hypothetical protein ONS95_013489 [Cadophora gregata]|uniref:uncharacterized protein n=1 Tax=Cadophora gregata TaxID=51156 RepID=UPI0026DC7457|nr:uncharacterized protein ONS95_013489 [Cadophora gregata]KAK0099614.1 hypothetical protein ONS96_008114 [Cadophora gregata f. sp. sojae]KAK0116475.1 hypothetical protein ONS95_013489 [Cadophora gregata]